MTQAADNAGKFYSVIKSLHGFDTHEVKPVIDTLISPTRLDNCFIGAYYRTLGNVETFLKLDSSKDFQAIAMLARALFELSVDARLLEGTPKAWEKVSVYADVEKLRAATRAIEFRKKHPDCDTDTSVFESYVALNSARIAQAKHSLWPNTKNPPHWSGLTLKQRVEQLKAPFDQIYEVEYARLSWYVHSGLTGILNLPAEAFIYLCSSSFHIASIAYDEALLSMVRVFKIAKVDEKIEEKLRIAKLLPFTKDQEQAGKMMKSVQ